jgi:hypothetical protein
MRFAENRNDQIKFYQRAQKNAPALRYLALRKLLAFFVLVITIAPWGNNGYYIPAGGSTAAYLTCLSSSIPLRNVHVESHSFNAPLHWLRRST